MRQDGAAVGLSLLRQRFAQGALAGGSEGLQVNALSRRVVTVVDLKANVDKSYGRMADESSVVLGRFGSLAEVEAIPNCVRFILGSGRRSAPGSTSALGQQRTWPCRSDRPNEEPTCACRLEWIELLPKAKHSRQCVP